MMHNEILIYQQDGHEVEVRLDSQQETLWLSQAQIAEIFGTQRPAVTKHLGNIFKSNELDKDSACSILEHTAADGKTYKTKHYNLDAVIAIGYRVNSKRATQFRIWATRTLREHLTKGYTLNRQRFEQNAEELQQALALIQKTAKSPALSAEAGSGLVDIVSRYTQTFLWLQQYDEGLLAEPKGATGGTLPSANEAMAALTTLKQTLITRGEATELFARLRDDGLASILGNLDQTVFGEPAYPTIESKAAHLLYFVVKNHPFSDGNKRSGAYLFVDFLHRNNHLYNTKGEVIINDVGLAALTLLIAESAPAQKEVLIRLVMHMLNSME
tara:strand:+ start:4457 stop:5440 length:984 start_codon:yes stop_codon:yes gene_type:complete